MKIALLFTSLEENITNKHCGRPQNYENPGYLLIREKNDCTSFSDAKQ